jgi:MFS superfamily sulfate permease-like transporter
LLRKFILHIKDNSTVVIDASKAKFIDHDILETLNDFMSTAPDDNIVVEIIDLYGKESINTDHQPLIVLNERVS